ncbi:MAG TPA: hypothetical protein VGF19_13565 [Candidatus Acidoferrum sp.]
MPQIDPLDYADPLDLLRRFIPTPLQALYRIGAVRVTVKTNDITLLPAFPLDLDLEVHAEQCLEWRLIRDAGLPDLLGPPLFMISGMLTIVTMGPACLIAVDHQQRELLAFLGTSIDARTHEDCVIPLLCQLTNEVFPAGTSLRFMAHDQASQNG